MKPVDTIHQYIQHAILEHRIPPGTRLRELELAEIFGVKRGQIRKVLARLTSAKLVEHIPNVGAQVACPSLKEGQDLFATRRILEQAVIRQICGNLTHAQIRELHEHLRLESAAYVSGNAHGGVGLSVGFHRKLAGFADNSILSEFLQEILNRTPLVMMTLVGGQASDSCINQDHANLVTALESGDCQAAVDIMDRHLKQLQDMFSVKSEPTEPNLADIFKNS
jgi:DNA-binding GntR family transcriptional regulator